MIKKIIQRIYLRIYIAEFLDRLRSLQQDFTRSDHQDYSLQLNSFTMDFGNFLNRYFPDTSSGSLSRIKTALQQRHAIDLPHLYQELNTFLYQIYPQKVVNRGIQRKMKFFAIFLLSILLIAAVYPPARQQYREEKNKHDLLLNSEKYKQKILADISALKNALQSYHNDHHRYPKSSGGWDAVVAAFGQSREDWIPGLAPRYISKLPSDPRKYRSAMEQYMYKSDGTDYKLIAHYPVGFIDIIQHHPELADVVRPSWAIGVWTERAKSW